MTEYGAAVSTIWQDMHSGSTMHVENSKKITEHIYMQREERWRVLTVDTQHESGLCTYLTCVEDKR